MVQRIIAQELANYPNAAIVASGHGFAAVEHDVNLSIPFVNAGLIQVSKAAAGATLVTSWQASRAQPPVLFECASAHRKSAMALK